MEKQTITKRIKRDKPNKKWTEDDIRKILNYLQDAPEIEAPTAQIFYKKFIETSHIDATWELIRWKVRHLKDSFKKANDWWQSTGAGLLNSNAPSSSVEGKVLQICPHYNQLKEIFGEKNGNFLVINCGDVVTMEDCITPDTVDSLYSSEEMASTSPTVNFFDIRGTGKTLLTQSSVDLTQSESTNVPKKAKNVADKLKKNASKPPAAHLAALQAQKTEMFKIKLEWEKEKHEKELALSHRKLKLEEEKVRREMDFKVLQLKKEENLKILEMEKAERLQKFEIEMKYKFQSENVFFTNLI